MTQHLEVRHATRPDSKPDLMWNKTDCETWLTSLSVEQFAMLSSGVCQFPRCSVSTSSEVHRQPDELPRRKFRWQIPQSPQLRLISRPSRKLLHDGVQRCNGSTIALRLCRAITAVIADHCLKFRSASFTVYLREYTELLKLLSTEFSRTSRTQFCNQQYNNI